MDALSGETAHVLLDVPNSHNSSRLTIRLENAEGGVIAAEMMGLAGEKEIEGEAIYSLEQKPVLIPVLVGFAVLLATATALAVRVQPGAHE